MSLILMILMTIASFQAQTLVSAQLEKFDNCSISFKCGNIKRIGYPFWGSARPSYCGHPDFHLACNGQNATMSMSGLTYRVLNIDDSPRVLTLARTDYYTSICPRYLHNNSINTNFFTYYQDTLNLTIYYNCSTAVPSNYVKAGLLGQTNCTINGTKSADYYVIGNLTKTIGQSIAEPIYGALDSCSYRIIAPTNQSAIPVTLSKVYGDADELVGILEQGFGLIWDADKTDASCSACKSSGGACGYSTGRFYCYCSRGEFPLRCNDGSVGK